MAEEETSQALNLVQCGVDHSSEYYASIALRSYLVRTVTVTLSRASDYCSGWKGVCFLTFSFILLMSYTWLLDVKHNNSEASVLEAILVKRSTLS